MAGSIQVQLAKILRPASRHFAHTAVCLSECWEPKNSPLLSEHGTVIVRSLSKYQNDDPINFRSLESPKNKLNNNLLDLENWGSFLILKGISRSLFFKNKDDKPKKKRIPKLILLQNPIRWLLLKIDFGVLKNIWDPTFVEKDFRFGTRQAITRVTHLISDGNYSELNGLLTKPARSSLLREIDKNWSGKKRSLLALNHEDIQISSPRKIYFIRIADKKYCDIEMAFLSLKWTPINNIDSLLFTEIFARFHREYTPHSIPEWTIAFFKVTRFEIIRR